MSLTRVADGIYRDPRTGNLYERPTIAGRRTFRKLSATTLTMARREVSVKRTRQAESKLGVALDPYAELVSIGQIAKAWLQRGCPDRKGIARTGQGLASERARVTRLLPFWKPREARTITAEDCRDYHAWRTRQNKRFRLGRSVDAELTTLSNLLHWAAQNTRKSGLRQNPLATGRPRFDNHTLTRHCTATMPMSDEVLHHYAAYLFASTVSQGLGWQLLLEAMTGARTSEILACRLDADEPRRPGYQDGHALHLNRAKKGIEPWALLETVPGHAPLAGMLAAFRQWHRERYKHKPGPWFIPGRERSKPMQREALTRALDRAGKKLSLPKITSHGLRAYFVRTLRSLGVDDSEIAKRLGHRSGVALVEQTYGVSEPGWFGSKKQDFLPAGKPAWTPWIPADYKKIINLAVYHPYTIKRKTAATLANRNPESKAHKTRLNIGENKPNRLSMTPANPA